MNNSPYSIENCSAYRKLFNDMDIPIPVYVFDSHNYALPAWGTVSNKIGEALNLITFDTHTDTRAPFSVEICQNGGDPDTGIHNSHICQMLNNLKYLRNDFEFEDVFRISNFINYDEQIKTAYDFGYLQSYYVIHRKNAEGYKEHDNHLGYKCEYYEANKIDWARLNSIESPIALDFDLDYFVRRDVFNTVFIQNLQSLIGKASVITIAKEIECFEEEKEEDDFTNEEALDLLENIICDRK